MSATCDMCCLATADLVDEIVLCFESGKPCSKRYTFAITPIAAIVDTRL